MFLEYVQVEMFNRFLRGVREQFHASATSSDGLINTVATSCLEVMRYSSARQMKNFILPGARSVYPVEMARFEGRDPDNPAAKERIDRPASSPLLTLVMTTALVDLKAESLARVHKASAEARLRRELATQG